MAMSELLGSESVTLEEMLNAREERVLCQRTLLAEFNMTLICFTLNIAGPYKAFPLAAQAFQEGKRLISQQLERNHISIALYKETVDKTGYVSYYVVNEDSKMVKALTLEIEDNCPLGRLFDIDVLRIDGTKISRQDMHCPERRCLLCSEAAPVCARSRAHTVNDLLHETISIISSYFDNKYAERIAKTAIRSLLYEVAVTPKPGLVDRINNGAHKDMDIFTFIDSTVSLMPYFRQLTLKGLNFDGTAEGLFKAIRYTGQQAEDAMFIATNGVNTHKGLIFSLGIICAALGYMHSKGLTENTDSLLDFCTQMTAHVLDDFAQVTVNNARTHGEKLYALYGITGIRGEVAGGFKSIKDYALPVLKKLAEQGVSLNDAGAVLLLHLLANVQDTNVISRADMQLQNKIQNRARSLIQDESIPIKDLIKELRRMDEDFICLNISPGGCADLLAITFMLYFLKQDSE